MSRPQFFLIAGPNGAGKSTMSAAIKRRFPSVQVIDPDAIAKDMTGSFATVDLKQVSAGRKALGLVKNCIDKGQSFIAESTISGSTYIRYANKARQNGFRTTFIYVGLNSPNLSTERIAKRIDLGGHAIPANDIARRYSRSVANLKAHIQLFASTHIYDNSQGYQWACDYRDGVVHEVSPSVPSWIQSYLP
ncbi:zeta toxin family protein [Microbulbifer sp. ZKSA006]|uniref:zeta toxin family protein n=1 Tax=Microbulbifer sp. ZKSA006 TaxID=3243390 RepID=UPI0040397A86